MIALNVNFTNGVDAVQEKANAWARSAKKTSAVANFCFNFFRPVFQAIAGAFTGLFTGFSKGYFFVNCDTKAHDNGSIGVIGGIVFGIIGAACGAAGGALVGFGQGILAVFD